jgi:xanthine dehydrogenase YagR molybdenum-binding subunit
VLELYPITATRFCHENGFFFQISRRNTPALREWVIRRSNQMDRLRTKWFRMQCGDKVHVVSEFMGGGFGSKFGAGIEGGLTARLSKEAGNLPVRLMLTRFDESLAVGNRPSSFQKVRLGAKKDGTLVAYELEAFGTAGFGSGAATAGGGGGAGFPAPYIYRVSNTRVRQTTVAINAGSARAMRAPGHPQASFGME